MTVSNDGATVYAGGDFTSIGGQARNRIAALSASTGLATGWNPDASSGVESLAVSSDHSVVYAVGHFLTIGGQSRMFLAALDPATGLATSWNPNVTGGVYTMALSSDDSTVYAAGNFWSVGGTTRNAIAAIDTTTGAPTSWNPNIGTGGRQVYALAFSGNTVYAGGNFTTVGGQSRNNIAAIDATTGAATSWNPGADDTVYALAASGLTVYAGGIFTSIGGESRNRLATLDAASGNATGWSPEPDNQVNVLALSGSAVYVGGNYKAISGESRSYFAQFDDTTPPTVSSVERVSASTTNSSSVQFSVTFSEPVTGVDTSDFTPTTTGTLSGVSVNGVTGAGASYTVTVNTGTGDGTLRLDVVDDDSIADGASLPLGGVGAGNGDYTSGQSYTIDRTGPTVSISSTAPDPTETSPIPVTVTFNEWTNGFEEGDLTVVNGTVSNFWGWGDWFEFDLIPAAPGLVSVDIPAYACQDLAGNWNTAAPQFTRMYGDMTPPDPPVVTGTTPTNDTTPTWSWMSGGGGGNGTYRHQLDGEAGAWTETTDTDWTPGAGLSDGAHTLYVQERDDTGNWSSSGSRAITVDTTAPNAPTVMGTTPTNDDTPTWSWSSGGGGNGTYRHQLDSQAGAWTETTDTDWTPGAGLSDGAHTLYVQERDDAGNWSGSGGSTITIDTTPPAVQGCGCTDPNPTSEATVCFTVTFSENVTGVDVTDFAVDMSGAKAVTGASVTGVSGSGDTYSVTVDTGNGNGSLGLDVLDDDTILDTAGNPLGGAGADNGGYTEGDTYDVQKDLMPVAWWPVAGILLLAGAFVTARRRWRVGVGASA